MGVWGLWMWVWVGVGGNVWGCVCWCLSMCVHVCGGASRYGWVWVCLDGVQTWISQLVVFQCLE